MTSTATRASARLATAGNYVKQVHDPQNLNSVSMNINEYENESLDQPTGV